MQVNQFDFALVVDTTGSMGGFIAATKDNMIKMIKGVSGIADIDIRVGLVEYRDHPPEDKSYVTKVYPFTDIDKAQQNINQLSIGGGGDWPEAVLDGVVHACDKLAWRPNARRIMVLVGDAPPHGCWTRESGMYGDRWPDGCPCGKTIESAAMVVVMWLTK